MSDGDAEQTRSYCNQCQINTIHTPRTTFACERRKGDTEYPEIFTEEWQILQCAGCESVKVQVCVKSPNMDDASITHYPSNKKRMSPPWIHSLPENCQMLIREIYSALGAECLILAAMGARTLIDLMLTDMLGDIGGFERKLSQAVNDDMISPAHKDVITSAVEAGHAASHRAYIPTASQLADVLEIVEHALKDRYVIQAASNRLKGAVPGREGEDS